MNIAKPYPFVNDSGNGAGLDEALTSAEKTLRLIASLPAPQGLEERVEAGWRSAADAASNRARILAWPVALRLESAWMRGAAAATIVFLVVGGGWGVSSRFQPAQQPARGILLLHTGPPGGFSSAGAMRTPQTLKGPFVAHPAIVSHPAKSAAKPKPMLLRRGKPAAANKATAQPAALPRK